MRIAITKGVLRVPPTYFAVQHALALAARHEVRVFGLVAENSDATLDLEICSAVPAFTRNLAKRQDLLIPLFVPRFRSLLRAWGPTILHHHMASWAAPVAASARRYRIPWLVTLHGADLYAMAGGARGLSAPYQKLGYRAVRREASLVLAVSEYLADAAYAAGVPSERLAVHYQGVDTDFFTPGAVVEPNPVPTVLHVGALERRKGVLDLLDASKSLVKDLPHRLLIVGQGSLLPILKAAAQDEEHVNVLPQVNRLRVRELMRQADLFVLATQEDQGWREAAGLVTLEAQACGTPVVVNDSGGAAEMVLNGQTGLVSIEKDVSSLRAAIGSLLELSPDERRSMGARGRQYVETERSLKVSVSRLEEIYLELVR